MESLGMDYDVDQCECDACGETFTADPAEGPFVGGFPLCPTCIVREFDDGKKTVEIPFETMYDQIEREKTEREASEQ